MDYYEMRYHPWQHAVDFALFASEVLGVKHRVYKDRETGYWCVEEMAAPS